MVGTKNKTFFKTKKKELSNSIDRSNVNDKMCTGTRVYDWKQILLTIVPGTIGPVLWTESESGYGSGISSESGSGSRVLMTKNLRKKTAKIFV
jgi:hypothetical protein